MNKGTDNKAIYFQSVFPAVSIIIPWIPFKRRNSPQLPGFLTLAVIASCLELLWVWINQANPLSPWITINQHIKSWSFTIRSCWLSLPKPTTGKKRSVGWGEQAI
jgi:hypothetical protein